MGRFTTTTYFKVVCNEANNIDNFIKNLELNKDELRRGKTKVNDYYLLVGENTQFNIDLNVMLKETLKNLLGKEETLVKLKEKYNLNYYLIRLVHMPPSSQIKPILSLDEEIIKFLYKSKSIDDLDLYN